MTDINALLDEVDALLDQNRVEEAGQLCKTLIGLAPDTADAWLMLGLISAETGDPATAEAAFLRAVALDATLAEAHLNLAGLLCQRQDNDPALRHALAAVDADADYSEAWILLGTLYAATRQPALARTSWKRALEIDPGAAAVWALLGQSARHEGDIDHAVECYRRAVSQRPDNADWQLALSQGLLQLVDYHAALPHAESAVALRPDGFEAQLTLGNLYMALDRPADAASPLSTACRLKPDSAVALASLGFVLYQQSRLAEALEKYRAALVIAPDLGKAWQDLGTLQLALGKLSDAHAAFAEALRCLPDTPSAHVNLGYALMLLNQPDQAQACFLQALQLDPTASLAHYNLGLLEKQRGHYATARAHLDQAHALDPTNADIRLSLSLLALLTGDFETGWEHYATRPSVRTLDYVRPAPWPPRLDGRCITIHKDQGIGDEIFFLRYAARLKARGAHIQYHGDAKIAALVARLPELDAVQIQPPMTAPVFDNEASASVGDLPFLLGHRSDDDIPPPLVLGPSAAARSRVATLLADAASGKPLIGLTWWAGMRPTSPVPGEKTAFREGPLHPLIEILNTLDATVVVVQRNPSAGDLASLRAGLRNPVLDLSHLNDDLDTLLALLDRLDDYLGVDNTNMHLVACLGKTARLLVPHPPEWRAMAHGDSSIWFPGFRLYRQTPDRSWDTALAALRTDLQHFR